MLSRLKICNFRAIRGLPGLMQTTVQTNGVIGEGPPLRCVSQQTPTKDFTKDKNVSTVDSRVHKFSTSLQGQVSEEADDVSKALTEQINTRITGQELGRLFAIIYVNGHQCKITEEDIIVLRTHIEADVGEQIRLNKVLLVGSKDFTLIGRPVLNLNLVRVEATVIEKTLSHTRVRFRYLRRQNNRKMKLKKEMLTSLRINRIDISPLNEQNTDHP